MFEDFIKKLNKLITESNRFVIIPHSNPDGDALGSCLALWHFLEKKNKQADIISPTEYPSFLNWLPGENNIVNYNHDIFFSNKLISKSEVIFMLDFNSFDRIEKIKHPIQKSNSKKTSSTNSERKSNSELLKVVEESGRKKAANSKPGSPRRKK